uniref:DUF6737 domain-containing protein n=1 Tax=Paulinella chromatophora TaxID=39717 RepID=B1X5J5_PAUCH|nr:hypothetical protein PCC_0800 [Paulinella chromatophora]ACB43214.1 hypothetical protein PCC_0800 [Paulinella chromatophora]
MPKLKKLLANRSYFWSFKDSWCQPWSIMLTGIAAILTTWEMIENWWLTISISTIILIWWILFLVVAPEISRISHNT